MSGLGDLRDPVLLEDPYPTYRRLLAEATPLWDEAQQMSLPVRDGGAP